MSTGVSTGYAKSTSTHWTQWLRFCAGIGLDPNLSDVSDPVPFLQIFAHRVRTGDLAKQGDIVKKRTVEAYLRAVGQVHTSVGARDPRHDSVGKIDFRIYRQLRSYQREDPPASRVKPVPVSVINHVYNIHVIGNACAQCIADIIWVAFFFLMRPGEYCNAGADNTSTPFRLCDVTFRRDKDQYHAVTTPLHVLRTCNHVSLTFTEQKKQR